MSFTYRPAARLEDVLPKALTYAQTQGEDAVFTFNKVTIVVTEDSSLDHIFSAFCDAPEGRTVGPCKLNLWRRLKSSRRPKVSRDWRPIEKAALRLALQKLRATSIHRIG